jgi:hypothetical protein
MYPIESVFCNLYVMRLAPIAALSKQNSTGPLVVFTQSQRPTTCFVQTDRWIFPLSTPVLRHEPLIKGVTLAFCMVHLKSSYSHITCGCST